MPKKSKASKFSKKSLIFSLAVVLLLASVGFLFVFSKHLLNRVTDLESDKIGQLIVRAIDGITKEAVVEPLSGRVFMPDARLVLPAAPSGIGLIRYSYAPAADDQSAEVQITSRAALSTGLSPILSAPSGDEVFEAVPKAQACSRQFILMFDDSEPPYSDYEKVGSKLLEDGRMVTYYKSNTCSEDFGGELKAYLGQIQSY